MKKIFLVAGARPNFMKIAPLFHALVKSGTRPKIIHTGQHYDRNMSDIFFEQLELPPPDIHLGIGSGTHGTQTGKIMIAFEEVVFAEKPDLVIVAGDVNSTIACALVAVKQGIPVAHVESGLRSFDRAMPEEINRIMTDQICDFLLTPSQDGDRHLREEGIADDKILFVGNIMIDSLVKLLPVAEKSSVLKDNKVSPKEYGLLTLHRPSNVDDNETFLRILDGLESIQKDIPLLFPVHPRTRGRFKDVVIANRLKELKGIRFIDPVGYVDFLALQKNAKVVLTDSGGIQEETTFLKVPCITIRENTERPITIELGTNQLVGTDSIKIADAYSKISGERKPQSEIPPLWDGKTAERIVEIFKTHGFV